MPNANCHRLEPPARQVLVRQAALAIPLVLWILAEGHLAGRGAQTAEQVISGGYGVLLGMLGTVMAWRSARQLGKAALKAPPFAWGPVYLGLLNRLIIVGGGLALGMVVLGLGPIYTVAGYLVSQLAFVWGWGRGV